MAGGIQRWMAWGGVLCAAAAVAGPAPPMESPEEEPAERATALLGEITALGPSGFELRPWHPDLPARQGVSLGAGVRVAELARARARELREGERVAVLTTGPLPRERSTEEVPRRAEPERPVRVRAFVRLAGAPAEEVAAEAAARRLARALVEAGLPYLPGRGGRRLLREGRFLVGELAALRPPILRAGRRSLRLEYGPETPLLHLRPIPPERLRTGRTVLVYPALAAKTPPVEARLVAIAPHPRISHRRQRRLILREQRRGASEARR